MVEWLNIKTREGTLLGFNLKFVISVTKKGEQAWLTLSSFSADGSDCYNITPDVADFVLLNIKEK